ncbi:MAG: hypothetical protein R3318_01710 [Gammaproteobacteria bacterium]|nr:hypothetical protein [Gammaproteobacteria bacterium]
MPYVIVAAILAIVAGAYFFLAGPGETELTSTEPVPAETTVTAQPEPPVEDAESAGTAPEPPQSDKDLRFAEKKAIYEELEKARRDLGRRLARVKMSLWNVRLPKEEANKMSEQLMNAARLIQRPKLMGAFRNLEEMKDELTRVEYAKERVEELRLQVESLNAQDSGGNGTG